MVLSGGAARGIAHLGVLQALEEAGIRPQAIAGVSAGAIVGAFYCNGYSPAEILKIIKETPVIRTLRPTRSPGLLKLDKAESLFRKYLHHDTFEKLDIPLFFSASNVETAQEEYFSQGELIPPLLGSISFPPFFRPIRIHDKLLADGGLINNLPADPVKDYQVVLGVNVNIVKPTPGNLAQYAEWVATVVVTNNIQQSKKLCHLFFEPPGMRDFRIIDIGKADEIFQVGYRYGKDHVHEVAKKLNA